jgi:hyaluronan synthase
MHAEAPSFTFGRRRFAAGAVLVLSLLGVAWACRHVWILSGVFTGHVTGRSADFAVVWALAFVLFAAQIVLAWSERPYVLATAEHRATSARFRVVVNVPLFNEEPALLIRAVRSILDQSRPVDLIEVVDDGSDEYDYSRARAMLEGAAARHYPGTELSWRRQANQGKRHAQMVTFRRFAGEANVIAVTVDSDTVLDRHAVEQGLIPFAVDPQVQSVAGLYLGLNATDNLITRIGELICVSWQLVGRSALSTVKSVIVNSGAFALYRLEVLTENEKVYLNETFFGKPVPFSDDAHLAMLATARGKTVQQPTAASFTLYPTSFRVYCKQYTRWMRGAAIRAWWRLRHLPLSNLAFWNEFQSWVQFILASIVFVYLYAVWPVVDGRLYIWSVVIPFALGYVVCARYLLVEPQRPKGPDELRHLCPRAADDPLVLAGVPADPALRPSNHESTGLGHPPVGGGPPRRSRPGRANHGDQPRKPYRMSE